MVPLEKVLAREVFDAALQAELSEAIAEFKAKAAAVASPFEMWEVGEYLREKEREISDKYDFRYSQLIWCLLALFEKGGSVRSSSMGCPRKSLRILDACCNEDYRCGD